MVCSVPLVKPAERDKLKKKDELLRDVLLEFVASNRRKGLQGYCNETETNSSQGFRFNREATGIEPDSILAVTTSVEGIEAK